MFDVVVFCCLIGCLDVWFCYGWFCSCVALVIGVLVVLFKLVLLLICALGDFVGGGFTSCWFWLLVPCGCLSAWLFCCVLCFLVAVYDCLFELVLF